MAHFYFAILVTIIGLFGKKGFVQLHQQGLSMSVEEPTINKSLKYLALGDSYTIGESVSSSARYPVQLVNLLRSEGLAFEEPEILATTGWTSGDLLSAMNSCRFHPPYKLVTLLIGVNNQYQSGDLSAYAIEFRIMLKKAIELAGGKASHVIVLSIPDYAYAPFAKGSDTASISRLIDEFNKINRKITDECKGGYLDITLETRKMDESLLAGDGLHYSGKEYAIWAKMLLPKVKDVLSNG
ncbi:MAG: GDSL-type esterase/lipase family protein [Chitinophagales bacterium]